MPRFKLALPSYMADLPDGSPKPYRGQLAYKQGDMLVADVSEGIADLWRFRKDVERIADGEENVAVEPEAGIDPAIGTDAAPKKRGKRSPVEGEQPAAEE